MRQKINASTDGAQDNKMNLKQKCPSLSQWALEVTNDAPVQALIIYTDYSRSDTGRAGADIFRNTPGSDVKISIRNSDHCFTFRSELIAISPALDHALSTDKDNLWILTDSRSSIQYLKTSTVQRLWTGNETADELAGKGCDLPDTRFSVLSHPEIHSLHRIKMNDSVKTSSLSLQYRRSRVLQTVLALFRSSRQCNMTFVYGVKTSFTYPCFFCSSSGLLEHFPGTIVWISRSVL
ncbi:RNase H domain-containing protein [Trichonephila clavipes]|nr:RNase H domain-containing protein [Trichonephila clavipes]